MDKPKWRFVISYNDAIDEHLNMPGVFGLFSGNGFCFVAIVLRPNGSSIYHGEFGVIIANKFFGWWYDERPSEWTRENG